MTLSDWLKNASKKLAPMTCTPKLDAEILLLYVTKINKATLYTHPENSLSDAQCNLLEAFLAQRLVGMPLAYIVGEKEFWSLSFKVSPDVLIPRPETEHLVELTLEFFKTDSDSMLLELGTGSGSIAIALAHERPDWKILASDKSPQALAIAKENAQRLLTTHPVNLSFCLSDWFTNIPPLMFSGIISNPPYIAENDPHLGALKHEPISALSSGAEGLDDIQNIITHAPHYLHSGGMLLLEHSYNQGKAVRQLLEEANFTQIKTFRDLGNNERITMGKICH